MTPAPSAFATLALLLSQPALAVEFGDDRSQYALNGQCDDLRFEGPGMEGVILLNDDVLHDATDCRTMVASGEIRYIDESPPDFGDDSSEWARDGECDDPRFAGPGMTTTALLSEDIRSDATDCRQAWEAGRLWLR